MYNYVLGVSVVILGLCFGGYGDEFLCFSGIGLWMFQYGCARLLIFVSLFFTHIVWHGVDDLLILEIFTVVGVGGHDVVLGGICERYAWLVCGLCAWKYGSWDLTIQAGSVGWILPMALWVWLCCGCQNIWGGLRCGHRCAIPVLGSKAVWLPVVCFIVVFGLGIWIGVRQFTRC